MSLKPAWLHEALSHGGMKGHGEKERKKLERWDNQGEWWEIVRFVKSFLCAYRILKLQLNPGTRHHETGKISFLKKYFFHIIHEGLVSSSA